MKFFMPQTRTAGSEAAYQNIADSLKTQFRLPIEERRIFSLSYVNSKKSWRAEVGRLEEQESRYQIVAIFESKSYIVFTRAQDGTDGLTILVDKTEVTAVEDFD